MEGAKKRLEEATCCRKTLFESSKWTQNHLVHFQKWPYSMMVKAKALEDKLLINLGIRPLPLFLRKIVALVLYL